MKRVGVVVHPTRHVQDSVQVLESWTEARGLELVQTGRDRQPPVAPLGEVRACDLVVALGGDGTLLKALHLSARTRTPVLGVAYGSLGALTAVAADELRVGLDRFAAGDWHANELPALEVRTDGEQVVSALNDLVVTRGMGTQLILDVRVGGELYVRLAGDGVVVSTPLGSSAYSMAAGGSLLAEGAEGFVCTPLSMHGGCAPPVVVAGDGEVTIEVHPGHAGFYVDVDGFRVQTDSQRFAVSKEDAYATLVQFDESSTGFSRLRELGLISDSPRLASQTHKQAQIQSRDDRAPRRARETRARVRELVAVGRRLAQRDRGLPAWHSQLTFSARTSPADAARDSSGGLHKPDYRALKSGFTTRAYVPPGAGAAWRPPLRFTNRRPIRRWAAASG